MTRINPYKTRTGEITYKVRFRLAGRKNPTSETFSGPNAYAEAQKFVALMEQVGPDVAKQIRDESSAAPVEVWTLGTWFEHHLRQSAASVTPGTIDDNRRMAERTWLPRWRNKPITLITRAEIIRWVAQQRATETHRSQRARAKALEAGTTPPTPVYYSAKSIKNAHGLLSTVLSRAVEEGQLTTNPARGVELPDDDQSAEHEILTEAEWQQVAAAIDPHYLPLTVFLISTGARIGEASAIQVKDFDLAAGTVRIRRAWKKGERDSRYLGSPKTRRSNRTVQIGAGVIEAVRPLLAGKSADNFVFVGKRGGRVQPQHFRNRVWQPALEQAGITKRVRVHDLRHTSASWMLMAGVPAQVVQHRLGHENLSTTSKVYAHLLIDAQLGAAQVMDRLARSRPEIEG